MRRILAATVASTFLGIAPPASAQWASHQAVRATSFQNSVGVNIGLNSEWDTAYSDNANGGAGYAGNNAASGPVLINGRTQTNVSRIVQAIYYLGAGHARMSLAAPYVADRLQAIIQAVPWFQIDLLMVGTGQPIGDALNLAGNLANHVEAIEGLNEAAENASYEGLYGAAADCRFQSELVGAARNWNGQHGVNAAILAPTASGQSFGDFGALSQCAWASTASNGHFYTDNTGPTQQVQYDLPFVRQDAPYGAPVWGSEAGYSTNPAAPRGLSEDVAAKRTLSALLSFFANGVVRTYLYELADENPQYPRLNDNYNAAELEMHYGLFNNDWSPKQTARMLHSQLQLLQDYGNNAWGFSPGSMSYNITNQPNSTHSLLMQKSDGSWLLAVWAEPPGMYVSATNYSYGYETNTPTSYPTIQFDRSFALIQTADPFTAGWDTPTINRAGAYTNSVTVPLSDHVIYLILKP